MRQYLIVGMKNDTVEIIDITEVHKQRTLDILGDTNKWATMLVEVFTIERTSASNEMWAFSTVHTKETLQVVFEEHRNIAMDMVRHAGRCLYKIDEE